jgi:hypothetical protein
VLATLSALSLHFGQHGWDCIEPEVEPVQTEVRHDLLRGVNFTNSFTQCL